MAKTEDVRAMNLNKVKEVFIQEGVCTKNMLAKQTGLSLGTCTNLLKQLLDEGKIKRIEDSASTGGRKAKRYQLIDNIEYYGVVYHDNDIYHFEKIDVRGQVVEKNTTTDVKALDDWLSQDFKNIAFCGLHRESIQNAMFYAQPSLVASYGYSQENQIEDVALIYQAPQQLSSCGLVLHGKMIHGKTNFAGEISYIPIENQVNQFKMLKSKKEATNLMAKQIAAIVSMVDPEVVVVISDKVTSLEKLNAKVLKWIDEKHLPKIEIREDFSSLVMQGLKRLCLEE